jgi:hypothetical protein
VVIDQAARAVVAPQAARADVKQRYLCGPALLDVHCSPAVPDLKVCLTAKVPDSTAGSLLRKVAGASCAVCWLPRRVDAALQGRAGAAALPERAAAQGMQAPTGSLRR